VAPPVWKASLLRWEYNHLQDDPTDLAGNLTTQSYVVTFTDRLPGETWPALHEPIVGHASTGNRTKGLQGHDRRGCCVLGDGSAFELQHLVTGDSHEGWSEPSTPSSRSMPLRKTLVAHESGMRSINQSLP
jgi:hypothetical protein